MERYLPTSEQWTRNCLASTRATLYVAYRYYILVVPTSMSMWEVSHVCKCEVVQCNYPTLTGYFYLGLTWGVREIIEIQKVRLRLLLCTIAN